MMYGNYLSTNHDRLLMRDGMKLMRKIGQTPALKSIIESELSPGTEVKTDEDFDEFVRANSRIGPNKFIKIFISLNLCAR